jgi:hypothetical protein
MGFEGVEIDRVREYWDLRPCNVRHSTQPIGTREYFDEVEARKYLVEPHILASRNLNGGAGRECWRSRAKTTSRNEQWE